MNRSGYVSVSLAVFTPLLLVILCACAGGSLLLLQWRRSHEFCQTRLLGAQEAASKHINELFALNPEAASLRAEEISAQAELAASVAGGPPAVAAAQARLEEVHSRQALLRGKQEWLKARAILDPTMKLIVAQSEIAAMNGIEGAALSNAHLFVKPRPAVSNSPDYVPQTGFSKRQALKGSWSLVPSEILPEWLRKKIPRIARARGSCTATVIQKGERWNATLGEGKSSSNF